MPGQSQAAKISWDNDKLNVIAEKFTIEPTTDDGSGNIFEVRVYDGGAPESDEKDNYLNITSDYKFTGQCINTFTKTDDAPPTSTNLGTAQYSSGKITISGGKNTTLDGIIIDAQGILELINLLAGEVEKINTKVNQIDTKIPDTSGFMTQTTADARYLRMKSSETD